MSEQTTPPSEDPKRPQDAQCQQSPQGPANGPAAAAEAFGGWLQKVLASARAPQWLVGELQNRLVLLLNHVLAQEPQAQDRLRRQKGQAVSLQWTEFTVVLVATPAGLLALADPAARPELRVTVSEPSLPKLLQTVLAGQRPAVDIQGDVQLAAEVAWLAEHVRWDLEEDLAGLLGDGPAHQLVAVLRSARVAVRGFVAQVGARSGAIPDQPQS